jgi:hypothetical protein
VAHHPEPDEGDEMMSKRSLPPPASECRTTEEIEAIALRIHQIAATAGVIAGAQAQGSEALSHALYLIEETLLEVEARVERLRV